MTDINQRLDEVIRRLGDIERRLDNIEHPKKFGPLPMEPTWPTRDPMVPLPVWYGPEGMR